MFLLATPMRRTSEIMPKTLEERGREKRG